MTKTILFLAANPKDTPQLRLDQEVRDVEDGLKRARRRDEFNIQQAWAVRPMDVRRSMLELRPSIVHFLGHGAGEEGLAFEDNQGNTNLVPSKALAGLFELFSKDLICVVLNACYSETQASAIVEHVDYVIGMQKAIKDGAAIEFSVAFYDVIGSGYSIEFAYKIACNALQFLDSDISECLTPVLKKREILQNDTAKLQTDSPVRDTDELFSWLQKLFISWTCSGFLKQDSENNKYALAAFGELLEKAGIDSVDYTLHEWLEEAKKVVAQSLGMPRSQMDWLEFDITGPFEDLSIEDSFFRLWKAVKTERDASNMATVRLAMVAILGEERQQELIGEWN